MKFLLDENLGKKVAQFIQDLGYFTLQIKEIHPGISDIQVLALAASGNFILLTADKDFGELVYKYGKLHTGIVLLRLENQTSDNKIRALKYLFTQNKQIAGFTVIMEKGGRFKTRKRLP